MCTANSEYLIGQDRPESKKQMKDACEQSTDENILTSDAGSNTMFEITA
jgi:hypothetical protein